MADACDLNRTKEIKFNPEMMANVCNLNHTKEIKFNPEMFVVDSKHFIYIFCCKWPIL